MFGTPQFWLPLLRCPSNPSWSQTHQMPCVRREFRLSIFSILFKTLLQTLLSSLLSRLFTSLWALFESNTFWFSSSQIITSITVLVHRFLYMCSFFASPNPLCTCVVVCVYVGVPDSTGAWSHGFVRASVTHATMQVPQTWVGMHRNNILFVCTCFCWFLFVKIFVCVWF